MSNEEFFNPIILAQQSLINLSDNVIEDVINKIAKATVINIPLLLEENKKDINNISKYDPQYDRLLLTEERLLGIADDLIRIAKMASPVGVTIETIKHENGMYISKQTVPFGVIGVIYEARPNVSFDVFALCFKSKNSCILKGGSNAKYSNKAIIRLIHEVLEENKIDPNICTLLSSERSNINILLKARKFVDLIIPRGSKDLINYVQEHSLVPIIETGAGVCHTYFSATGNTEIGKKIIYNAKTRRVSVCNSLDCLIIHESRLNDLFSLCEKLIEKKVEIYADEQAFLSLIEVYPSHLLHRATEDDFGIEYLDLKMSIVTVKDTLSAIKHIHEYGSKHSECIISEDDLSKKIFIQHVDAACVYINVSTAFTDGGEFGFGAEIGISTQKMHARGPMSIRELCTYKWVINGDGQVR